MGAAFCGRRVLGGDAGWIGDDDCGAAFCDWKRGEICAAVQCVYWSGFDADLAAIAGYAAADLEQSGDELRNWLVRDGFVYKRIYAAADCGAAADTDGREFWKHAVSRSVSGGMDEVPVVLPEGDG